MDIECKFELKKVSNTRSSQLNRAMHLYYTFISSELNGLGLEFEYTGLMTKGLSSRYTPLIVKEFIWRPIQIAMFDITSTKDMNSNQINEIIDVIVSYFGNKGIN